MKILKSTVAVLALSAASLSALAMTDADRYGVAADSAAAVRTIVIGPSTTWVNVTRHEIVRIVANGKEFTWNFDGAAQTFNLKRVAPQGAIEQDVQVYVAQTERDFDSGD